MFLSHYYNRVHHNYMRMTNYANKVMTSFSDF